MSIQNSTTDTKFYLRERINHYTEQLETSIANTFGELIHELREECIQHLRKIRQRRTSPPKYLEKDKNKYQLFSGKYAGDFQISEIEFPEKTRVGNLADLGCGININQKP